MAEIIKLPHIGLIKLCKCILYGHFEGFPFQKSCIVWVGVIFHDPCIYGLSWISWLAVAGNMLVFDLITS